MPRPASARRRMGFTRRSSDLYVPLVAGSCRMAAWGKRVSAASSVGDFGEARVRSIEFRLFFATLHEKPLDDKHVEVRGLAAHGSVAARQHVDPAELGPEGTPSASGLADYSSRRRNS